MGLALQNDVSQHVLLKADPPLKESVQRLFPQDRRTLDANTPFYETRKRKQRDVFQFSYPTAMIALDYRHIQS